MTDSWKNIIDKAKTETDQELIEVILDKSTLSESMVESIAPSTIDKTKLKELVEVMRSAETIREKAEALAKISEASDVVVNLIGKFL